MEADSPCVFTVHSLWGSRGEGWVVYFPFSAMVLGLADGGGWARGETGVAGGEIIADGGRRIMKSLPPEYGRDEALVLRNRGEFEKPN